MNRDFDFLRNKNVTIYIYIYCIYIYQHIGLIQHPLTENVCIVIVQEYPLNQMKYQIQIICHLVYFSNVLLWQFVCHFH